jgi:hypothetical protein
MAGYFSTTRVAELNAGRDEARRQFDDLRDRLFTRTYKTDRGAEFVKHGLGRRLDILVRAIDQVWQLLPPEQEKIPPHDDVVDAGMAIRAFLMNAFGCLDNIAWVLVNEKNIKGKWGAELEPKSVGLGKRAVREHLSKEFLTVVDRHADWFANLINFRDSLAHRIPLYIPPYIVPEANIEMYNQLEKAKWEEPARSNPKQYEKLKTEQLELCNFVPGMTHSIFEQAPSVEFHTQLLTDYATIDEYVRAMLEELDRG